MHLQLISATTKWTGFNKFFHSRTKTSFKSRKRELTITVGDVIVHVTSLFSSQGSAFQRSYFISPRLPNMLTHTKLFISRLYPVCFSCHCLISQLHHFVFLQFQCFSLFSSDTPLSRLSQLKSSLTSHDPFLFVFQSKAFSVLSTLQVTIHPGRALSR